MQQSNDIDKLAAALAAAQGAIQNPSKNREVSVSTRTGGAYKFSYATLDNIFDVIRKPLADNGLSFLQTLHTLEDGRLRLITLLMHASGQWIKTETPVQVKEEGMQALGSAQTYARRYAISSLLGIAADEDDDANAADGNTVTNRTDRKASGHTNGNGKTAAPNHAPEPWKEDAERIKAAIDGAPDEKTLDDLFKVQTKVLAEIKSRSQSAYDFLMDRAAKKRAMLAQKAA